jgi:hypothetical protein
MAGKATFVEPSRPPTAPPEDVVFTARQTSIVARGLNSECTICLDSIVSILTFHVCLFESMNKLR